MTHVSSTLDVERPVRDVYNQWTQFEDFPRFMEGVEEVVQLDDSRLHWRAEIAGIRREWDARIVEQLPDSRVAWESMTGATNAGNVSFVPIDSQHTRVTLDLDFEPEGALEKVGDVLGFVNRRVEGDLQRFKDFIEGRDSPTGAWRGRIAEGHVESEGTTARTPSTPVTQTWPQDTESPPPPTPDI